MKSTDRHYLKRNTLLPLIRIHQQIALSRSARTDRFFGRKSRPHQALAIILVTPIGVQLRACSADASCTVNGRPVYQAPLFPGDVIGVGRSRYQYLINPPRRKLWLGVASVLTLVLMIAGIALWWIGRGQEREILDSLSKGKLDAFETRFILDGGTGGVNSSLMTAAKSHYKPLTVSPKTSDKKKIDERIDEVLQSLGPSDRSISPVSRVRLRQRVEQLAADPIERSLIEGALERHRYLFELIIRELNQADLPPMLAFLAVADSYLRPDIPREGSRTGGMWRMPVREVELVESHDIGQSTRAAVEYLSKLRNLFGDSSTTILMLAYRLGVNGTWNQLWNSVDRPRINRNIWYLDERQKLADPSLGDYVITAVSLAVIFSAPEEFDFRPPAGYSPELLRLRPAGDEREDGKL